MKSILIVDDDKNLLDLYTLLIGQRFANTSVERALNGIEALKKIGQNDYALILSDVEMPKMNGIDLHKKVKKEFPALASRTCFITGNCCPSHISYFKKEGVPYLMKPFDKKNFISLLETIIAQDNEKLFNIDKLSTRRHKRFSFRAEGTLLPLKAMKEVLITGEMLNFSEGGFAFLCKRKKLSEMKKVRVSIEALNIENKDAEMVWTHKESDFIKAGFKWIESLAGLIPGVYGDKEGT